LAAVSLASCSVGNVSKSGGVDNMSYLQFIQGGNTSYNDGVTVAVDDAKAFTAKVDQIKPLRVKKNTYPVSSGSHTITVTYKGTVLYQKTIVVGTQETKQIQLP